MSRSRLGRHGATCHLTSRGFGDAFTLVGQRIGGSRLAKGRSSRAPVTTRFGPPCGLGRRGRTGSNRFLLIRLLRLTPSFVGSAVRSMRSSMTALLPWWAQCPAALRIRWVRGATILFFGCCNLRKNICRDGLSEEIQGPMETILAMLRGWVDNMGPRLPKASRQCFGFVACPQTTQTLISHSWMLWFFWWTYTTTPRCSTSLFVHWSGRPPTRSSSSCQCCQHSLVWSPSPPERIEWQRSFAKSTWPRPMSWRIGWLP